MCADYKKRCPKLTPARSPVACKFIVGRVEITNTRLPGESNSEDNQQSNHRKDEMPNTSVGL